MSAGSDLDTRTDSLGNISSDTFNIAQVQFEKGSEATDFERLTHGEEVIQCERYYQELKLGADYDTDGTSTSTYRYYTYNNKMRGNPTATVDTQCTYWKSSQGENFTPSSISTNTVGASIRAQGLTTSRGFVSGVIALDAEL